MSVIAGHWLPAGERRRAVGQLKAICRGDVLQISAWSASTNVQLLVSLLVIAVGTGLYGASIGLWRAPLQGVFTALKFPLIILLTCAGNALINGMLAQLLGLPLSFRESSLAILLSFTLAAIILGSLSPVMFFLLLNLPPLAEASSRLLAHNINLLAHVGVIAFAGVTANLRLYGVLVARGGSRAAARKLLAAWLAVNLLVGSQVSWIGRPFIGSPELPVEFFRQDALNGNFYESVWTAMNRVGNRK